GGDLKDYKLNQKVVLDRAAVSLPSGFGMESVLSDALKETLALDAALLAEDKVATLKVYTNQAAEVRSALRAPLGGGVTIAANNLLVKADIQVAGGAIDLAARNNVFSPLNDTLLKVDPGVRLSARGAWVNELPSMAASDLSLPPVDAGSISLVADTLASSGNFDTRGTVALGQGVVIDASGGARVGPTGKITAGKGGTINLAGYAIEGLTDNVLAYGLEKGGKLNLTTNRIKIGGTPETDFGTLVLDPLFFARGGFADFGLTALSSLEVAQNTAVRPTVTNRELNESYATQQTGATLADFTQLAVRDDRVRQAANLSLSAKQSGAGTGELLVGKGARIEVDPLGKIALEARNTLDIEGTLVAHGGAIDVVLDRSSGVVSSAANQNALWLGKDAVLDVSGITQTYSDGRGLTQGKVLAGGSVNLNAKTGYVVAEEGSRINVSGAAPVLLGVLNEGGGLGRMVGSDAGAMTVFGEEGILLDASLSAHAGGAGNRGGTVGITLSKNAHIPGQTFDTDARTLALATTVAPQTAGMSLGVAIPVTGVVRARIGTDKLEAAGFDRMRFSSRDAIALEDGLELGAGRVLPLREIKLDAARIETLGGDAALTAETLLVGNYNPDRVGSTNAATNTGALTLNSQQLELAGKLRLEGMARAQFNGLEAIALAGVTTGAARPVGELSAAADLVFNGAVMAPSTYTQYSILAPGKGVSFTRNTDAPTQPLSAMGSLTIEAKDIVQDGNLWVPFGQIDFKASESLTFKSGSLTSVAAAPGSLLPFGKMVNGRAWVYDVDADKVPTGQLEQAGLGEKSIRTAGKSVDMQAGAKINLAGGGDMQAYEFTVGPGGSRDILNDANTYAILPSYRGGVAPGDAQEAKGFNRAVGDAVYLSGMPGLADGMYTLLPAHYALLPGAYAVKLNTGIKDLMPGQAFSGQDGVRMASGYLSDSRANAPRDAAWQGIQVLTGDQVRARSEFTLTHASDFFAAGKNRPQDAGLLSIATSGTGSNTLKLDATYQLDAASGGRGAAVDISALKLAVTSGTPSGIAADVTQIDVDKVNALGARSLYIGGTRVARGDTTTLAVGAQSVTLANDAAHALKAPEVILAASDILTLKSGSVIDAQGDSGDAGSYSTPGNGALVRAASTTATFTRSGSPDRSEGTLVGEAGSLVRAADSIALDATRENAFKGTAEFRKNGMAVAGNLGVGATRINLGAAPASADGIGYSQAELDGLNSLKGLTLTSYSTFDLYGDVNVGGLDANGKPTLQNLALQGAGLAGLDNSGKTANLRAKNITLSNPAAVAFVPGAVLGNGALAVLADTLTLGEGDKSVQGFSSVAITANELVGAGIGKTDVAAPVTINVARIRGEKGADQTLTANGALAVASRTADRALAQVTESGAKWALAGSSADFNTRVELPSGQFKLNATGGDLNLGADARVDVAGRNVSFFDVMRPTWGGSAEFSSDIGNVSFASGASVDVSAAAGADAGTFTVRAVGGSVTLADGSVMGTAAPDADGKQGGGARAEIDAGTLNNFSAINKALNTGGFDGARSLRARSGDVAVVAADTVKAKQINLAADGGKIDVAGWLDASGEQLGRIEIFAKNDVNVLANARLDAKSSGARQDGGEIEIGSRDGTLNLATGSDVNVS
ncbi:MAG: filamentous hemagglutinin, partial [Rhodoferax sp.]|nr:filamentous hemagglutinin [Rhodoferax sp.]